MQLPFFEGPVMRAGVLASAAEPWTLPAKALSDVPPGGDRPLAAQLTDVLSQGDLRSPEMLARALTTVAWLPWPFSHYALCALKFNEDVFPIFLKACAEPDGAASPREREAREILAARLEQTSRARLAARVFAPARLEWIQRMLEDLRGQRAGGASREGV